MIEIWGYLSMMVVIASMVMKDIKKLRITNNIACLMLLIYGLALKDYPIVIMNVVVITINLYRIKKLIV